MCVIIKIRIGRTIVPITQYNKIYNIEQCKQNNIFLTTIGRTIVPINEEENMEIVVCFEQFTAIIMGPPQAEEVIKIIFGGKNGEGKNFNSK
jgi:hypothetical protein